MSKAKTQRPRLVDPKTGEVRDLPPATPPGPPPLTKPVGTTVAVSAEDKATLAEANRAYVDLVKLLGRLRADYANNEHKVLSQLNEAHKRFTEMTVVVGKKLGLNLGEGSTEGWRYEVEAGTLTRTQ